MDEMQNRSDLSNMNVLPLTSCVKALHHKDISGRSLQKFKIDYHFSRFETNVLTQHINDDVP